MTERPSLSTINDTLARHSKICEEAGLATIRAAIKELSGIEQRLLGILGAERGKAPASPQDRSFSQDAEKVLERVVGEIARLISVASRVASVVSSTPLPTTAPSMTTPPVQIPLPPSVVPPPPPATPGKQRLHEAFLDMPPEIDPSEITLEGLIGQGAFARVYKGRCRGLAVAVKVPTKQKLSASEERAFRHEVTIMRRVTHPNVILLLGVVLQPGKLMIVTELMHGDIDRISRQRRLSLLQKLRMLTEAARGLNWLQGIAHILHRDLKPENLLCDEALHVRVADFGLSEILQGKKKDTTGPKGTALFAAPEVMRQEEFDEKADVYSYGLIIWQLVTGLEPFEEYDEIKSFQEAVCLRHERPPLEVGPNMPQALASLIERCWHPKPEKRPQFSEIVTTLESLIIDAIVTEDSPARAFWKHHFLSPLQEQVAWVEVEERVARLLKISPVHLNKIGELMCTGVTETGNAARTDPSLPVPLEKFQQFFVWFGPWFDAQAGPFLVHEINALTSSAWFHGDISSVEATARLQNRADGTFLVRLSTSVRQCPFTVSIANSQDPTQAQHLRVYRLSFEQTAVGGRYAMEIEEKRWKRTSTIPELVEALRSAFIVREPCPKNKLPPSYKRMSGGLPPPPASTPQ